VEISFILLGLFILLLFVENQYRLNKLRNKIFNEVIHCWQEDIEVKKAILEELRKGR
jgi:hypothetical protein